MCALFGLADTQVRPLQNVRPSLFLPGVQLPSHLDSRLKHANLGMVDRLNVFRLEHLANFDLSLLTCGIGEAQDDPNS